MVIARKTATCGSVLQVPRVPDLTCGFFIQNRDFSTRIASLYGASPLLWFCALKTAPLASELLVSRGPSLHSWFLHQNRDFITRITSVYRSQTSPVVLFLHNNVISIRITCLYGSQPLSVVFACNTTTFETELQVSKGPRLPLFICECKTACLDPE